MKITSLEFEGLMTIEPELYKDSRGFFYELWNAAEYQAAGLTMEFVQDNVSRSHKGVLRGLHFQNPKPQGKLVSVLEGEVFDVVVDLRKNSKTYKKWKSLRLIGGSHLQLYIPPGFAHGFQVLSESALFAYKCTEYYNPDKQFVLKWDDEDLNIQWPISAPIISERDLNGSSLKSL